MNNPINGLRRRVGFWRALVAVGLALTVVWLGLPSGTPTVHAAGFTTNTVAGTTWTILADNTTNAIVFGLNGGNARVNDGTNGLIDPTTGAVAANTLTVINITLGTGSDSVDLSGLTVANYNLVDHGIDHRR